MIWRELLKSQVSVPVKLSEHQLVLLYGKTARISKVK